MNDFEHIEYRNRNLTLDELQERIEDYLGMTVHRKDLRDDWGLLTVQTPTGKALLEISVGYRQGGWAIFSTSYDKGWKPLMRIHEEPVRVVYTERDGGTVKAMHREDGSVEEQVIR